MIKVVVGSCGALVTAVCVKSAWVLVQMPPTPAVLVVLTLNVIGGVTNFMMAKAYLKAAWYDRPVDRWWK